MPYVRKLSPEEVHTLEYRGNGQRKRIAEQYDAFLMDYSPGDYGEANLEADEDRLTIRNRFRAAAQRRGLTLDFLRTNGTILRFRVGTNDETSATPSLAVPADLPMVSSAEPPAIAADEPPVPAHKGRRKASTVEPAAAAVPLTVISIRPLRSAASVSGPQRSQLAMVHSPSVAHSVSAWLSQLSVPS